MKIYSAFGESKSLKDWSKDERCNCNFHTLKSRIYYGYLMEDALSFQKEGRKYEAFGEEKTLREWSVDKRCRCCNKSLYSRIGHGWPIEKALAEPISEFIRTSDVESYFGQDINNIRIISRKNRQRNEKRVIIECLCLLCGSLFEADFSAVKTGTKKSCSCVRKNKGQKSFAWAGFGEISKSIFSAIKRSAKERGLKFDLTIEQIWDLFLEQERKCAISGEDLFFPKAKKDHYNASLDRKNSREGYNIGNIQWVDRKINLAKQQLSDDDFIKMCGIVYKFNSNK